MCATPVSSSPESSSSIQPDAVASDAAAQSDSAQPVIVRWRGSEDYQASFDAMRAFTDSRTAETSDEIWLVEHPPVFTLGQAGDPAHLLTAASRIPLVKVDRGGQITYHGPGQVVAYLLLDLRSEEHTSELQSRGHLVCRLLLEKKKIQL